MLKATPTAGHPRLGAASEARGLDPEVVQMVCAFVVREGGGGAEGGGRGHNGSDWAGSSASDCSSDDSRNDEPVLSYVASRLVRPTVGP